MPPRTLPTTDSPSLRSDARNARAAVVTRAEFEEMAVELVGPLLAAARALTRRQHDAEDVVQETLLRAWRSIDTFERGTNFRGWLFRILHNTFANRWNRERKAPVATDPADFEAIAPEPATPDVRRLDALPAVADHHLDDRVKSALGGLAQHYMEPFVLFSLGDMTYAEIATALDIPVGTVMSRLHRARALLRERLTEYADESGFSPGSAP